MDLKVRNAMMAHLAHNFILQMKIDRIFSILVPQSGGQPELQHSASRLSVLSR